MGATNREKGEGYELRLCEAHWEHMQESGWSGEFEEPRLTLNGIHLFQCSYVSPEIYLSNLYIEP